MGARERQFAGSARVSRAGFGVAPKRTSLHFAADLGAPEKSAMARTPSPARGTRALAKSAVTLELRRCHWIDSINPIARMVARRIYLAQHRIHDCAIWRQFTYRICIRSISGQQRGLTTAAAKIDFFLWTTPAGLGHPFRPTESVEAFRFTPNPIEIACSDIFKTQTRNS